MLRNPHLPPRSQKSTKPHAPIPNTSSIASKIAACPSPSTGYGSGDRGRDALDKLAAEVFRAEAGFIRPSLLSGTHTLAVALYGILRPGDIMLSVTGRPYDTLTKVLGLDQTGDEKPQISSEGSLRDLGVDYRQLELLPDPLTSPRWSSSSDGTERR